MKAKRMTSVTRPLSHHLAHTRRSRSVLSGLGSGIVSPRGSRGFTLVELIVGTSIMAGVIASAYLCLHAGLVSQRDVDARADAVQKLRVVLGRMGRDLRAACVWEKDASFLGERVDVDGLAADSVHFVTHNWQPRAPGEGDLCEVSYYVKKNEATGALDLWFRVDSSIDDELSAGGVHHLLVDDIGGLRIEYYDGFDWHETWGDLTFGRQLERRSEDPFFWAPNLVGLPDTVRLTIVADVHGDDKRQRPLSFGRRGTELPPSPGELGETDAESNRLVFETVVQLQLSGRSGADEASAADSGSASGGPQ